MSNLSILEAAREEVHRDCIIEQGRALSFGVVAERVRARIDVLKDEGAAGARLCAITPEVSLDSLITIYALIELGVPLVMMHPRWSPEQRAERLQQAEQSDKLDPARCLAVVFTSGSTGEPKGVMLSTDAFVSSAEAHSAHLGWRDDDRWLLCMPPAHVGGLSIVTRCLHARRCIVLANDNSFEPAAIMANVEDSGVTLMSLVPTMLHRLMQHRPPWLPPGTLRAVLVGGAPLSNRLRFDAVGRGLPVLSTYGLSEACSQVTTQTAEQIGTAGSGKVLFGNQLRLDDGEIQISGPTMMDGYLDGSDGSRWTDDGWFRTRDIGRFETDGQLEVRGRVDDLIITGGENVVPLEVERFLLGVSGVVGACVFGVPDDEWGQVVSCVLVIEPAFDRTRFRAALEEGLADFQRPRKWLAVDSLPIGANGKLNRRQVAEAFAHQLELV